MTHPAWVHLRLSLVSIAAVCFFAAASTVKGITVADPTFAPAEGSSATRLNVVVSCATSGATIRYTLNGVNPTAYDTIITSGSSVELQRTQELRAKAWVGTDSSATVVEDFEITGEVAAGSKHALSLKSFGPVQGWGTQQYGRLANGSTSATVDVTSPGAFNYSSGNPAINALAIAAGYNHNVIAEHGSSGNVWAVGYGALGELGNNGNANATYPVKVFKTGSPSTPPVTADYLTGALAVAAGQSFSGALGSNNKVYTWGSQQYGRLGNGATTSNRQYAAPVKTINSGNPDLTGIAEIEFGDTQAMAREETSDPANTGYVWSWGYNANLQLGHGTSTASQPWAKRVVMDAAGNVLTHATSISTGDNHSAIVRWKTGDSTLQGSVWTVGNQQYGRLGNGVTTNTNIGYPARVKTGASTYLGDIVQVSCGSSHTLARDANGKVWAWGYNTKGALGNDTTTTTGNEYAAKVKGPSGGGSNVDVSGFLTNVVWISAGGITTNSFSLAVTKDGTIYAWGADDSGQLANGTSSTSAYKLPVAVGSFNLHPVFPTVAVSATTNPDIYPGAATLTAAPSDADGSIAKVEFFIEGVLVGTKTTAPWTTSLSSLAVGTYNFSVRVTDNEGNTNLSGNSALTIHPDTDSDGLSDTWELLKFTDLHETAESDPDHDGLTNAQEKELGSNPANPSGFADTDGDGLPDDWERYYFSNSLTQTATGDFDSDQLTNLWEYTHSTKPNYITNDGDGLPDDWERHYFGSTTPTAAGDFDSDGLTNAWEYAHVTNPASVTPDSDLDGLTDDWELYYFSNSLAQTGTGDYDSDKVTNAQERTLGTNPASAADGDGDGLPNDWEMFWWGYLFRNGTDDFDQDQLTNLQEFAFGTNPNTAPAALDSDGDWLPDDWEMVYIGNLTSGTYDDPDGDNIPNADERSAKTNPGSKADTDGDGLPDDWERYWFVYWYGASGAPLSRTALGDFDFDGYTNLQEFNLGTDPGDITDTDLDYLKDEWELSTFGNLDETYEGDPDGDGISNWLEMDYGLDPADASDGDSDGLPDDWEYFYFGTPGTAPGADGDSDKVSTLNEFLNGTNPASAADGDSDGLPNDWEIHVFGNFFQIGAGDADGDHATNLQEFTAGTNPNSATDGDIDGLFDDWEIVWFSDLAEIATTDVDGDHLTQTQEMTFESNPTSAVNTDSDSLPDDWERYYFTNLTGNASGDPDGDHVTNLQEWTQSTNPASDDDTDSDGLPDDWEKLHFNNTSESGSSDPDADGVSNLDEFNIGTNPLSLLNSDLDGLPDDWEVCYFGSITVATGGDDSDSDGLINTAELAAGTDPDNWDTDGDSVMDGDEVHIFLTNPLSLDSDGDWMPDGWEIDHGLDPSYAADGSFDSDGDGNNNSIEFIFMDLGFDPFVYEDVTIPYLFDHDEDGLTTYEELVIYGTNPRKVDTDGDLLPDGWEVENGLDPLNASDGSQDPDGDGLNNLQEWKYGSDPYNTDTDGDGSPDGLEVTQGSHPNDVTDGGARLPSDQVRAILIGIGDQSGSESEDYVLNCFEIDEITGAEKRFYTLRSGGFGKYKEEAQSIFRKDRTYTFQIQWQGSKLLEQQQPPDFDYTFKVDPQSSCGILVDSWNTESGSVDTGDKLLSNNANDVASSSEEFFQNFQKKRVVYTFVDLDIEHPASGGLSEDAERAGRGGIVAVKRSETTPVTKVIVRKNKWLQMVVAAGEQPLYGFSTSSYLHAPTKFDLYNGPTKVDDEHFILASGEEITLRLQGNIRSESGVARPEWVFPILYFGDVQGIDDEVGFTVVKAEYDFFFVAYIPYDWVTILGHPLHLGEVASGDTRGYAPLSGSYRLRQYAVAVPYPELSTTGFATGIPAGGFNAAGESVHYDIMTSLTKPPIAVPLLVDHEGQDYGNRITPTARGEARAGANLGAPYATNWGTATVENLAITLKSGGIKPVYRMVGGSHEPIVELAADIDWDMDAEFDTSDPAAPTCRMNGKTDGFPAYEAYCYSGVSGFTNRSDLLNWKPKISQNVLTLIGGPDKIVITKPVALK